VNNVNPTPRFRTILMLTAGFLLLAATEGAVARSGSNSGDHGAMRSSVASRPFGVSMKTVSVSTKTRESKRDRDHDGKKKHAEDHNGKHRVHCDHNTDGRGCRNIVFRTYPYPFPTQPYPYVCEELVDGTLAAADFRRGLLTCEGAVAVLGE